MNRVAVINVVGLTNRLIGDHTPFIRSFMDKGEHTTIDPVLPAVTCTAQSTYLTGVWPDSHVIVGNGWYFKEECEVKFWRQSIHDRVYRLPRSARVQIGGAIICRGRTKKERIAMRRVDDHA